MRLLGVLLAAAIVAAMPVDASPAGVPQGARDSGVVWFSGEKSQGLKQDSGGNLLISGRKLTIQKPVTRLYAAAYYPAVGVLVTVDGKAVTRLYEATGKLPKLMETRPPRAIENPGWERSPIRPVTVRFSSIPGLVYLTWSYPEPSVPVQMCTRFSERLALGHWARNWHAVTPRDENVLSLAQPYRIASDRSFDLFMSDGKKVVVRLPGPLGELEAPPYFRLEPVFVIPGRAIICKTRNGWSLHNLNGSLISYFPCGPAGNQGWLEPFFRNGHYYVAQACKGLYYWRMQVSTGRLVYVGEDLP